MQECGANLHSQNPAVLPITTDYGRVGVGV
jgi:hypothetical protein